MAKKGRKKPAAAAAQAEELPAAVAAEQQEMSARAARQYLEQANEARIMIHRLNREIEAVSKEIAELEEKHGIKSKKEERKALKDQRTELAIRTIDESEAIQLRLEGVEPEPGRQPEPGGQPESGERDELFDRAARLILEDGEPGRASMLQKQLGIGYGRAARILDQLTAANVLKPVDEEGVREVNLTLEQYEIACEAIEALGLDDDEDGDD